MATAIQEIRVLQTQFNGFQDEQKLMREYLERDVKRALNGQEEIYKRLNNQDGEINHLKLQEAKCPIAEVSRKVTTLLDETEQSRAKYKFPELQKGVLLLHTVGSISALIMFISVLIAIISHWKQIF